MDKPSEDLHILKLKVDEISDELLKRGLKINNAEIDYISKKEKYESLLKFTFEINFQYLDKEEIATKDIFIYENKPLELDLSDKELEEGDKKEINIPDTREPYFVAKEELLGTIDIKKKEILDKLEKSIEIEKSKIEKKFLEYYSKYLKDFKSLNETLFEFEKEGDFDNAKRQKKLIEELKNKYRVKGLEENKERAFQIEEQKHMLNISKRLVKTTLIYFPVLLLGVYYKNHSIKKKIEISFNTLNNDLEKIKCEDCGKNSPNMYLGAKGHICCEDCAVNCQVCHKIYCRKCSKNECEICSKIICKECSVRCYRCNRLICKSHVKENRISKRVYCEDCMKRCERCGELKDPYTFKVSKKTNADICEECYRNEMQEKVLRDVF